MASKKPRKKKYSPKKTLNKAVRYSLRNWGMVWAGTEQLQCYLGNLRTGKLARPNPAQATALLQQPFKWHIVNAIFCRDQNGREYMQEETLVITDACLQDEVVDFVTEHHKSVIKGANQNHRITIGWLACPIFDVDEVPQDNIDKIFRALGVYDHLAEWEVTQLNQEDSNHVNS